MASSSEFDKGRELRSRSRGWDQFVPQMLANAAGTLVAAAIIYVYGVAVGLIRANWRVLAPILLLPVIMVVYAAWDFIWHPSERIEHRQLLWAIRAIWLLVFVAGCGLFGWFARDAGWSFAAMLGGFLVVAVISLLGAILLRRRSSAARAAAAGGRPQAPP